MYGKRKSPGEGKSVGAQFQTLFDEVAGHGEVALVGRVGQDDRVARVRDGAESVAHVEGDAGNAVCLRVFPGGLHRQRVHVHGGHAYRADFLCGIDSHRAVAAAQMVQTAPKDKL